MPSRITPSSEYEESSKECGLLRYYSVSNNGFLPQREPLRRLPHAYYTPWEAILDDLPSLIKQRRIREVVDSTQVLSTNKLHTEEEWRRAYVVLSFLAHAYIWGGDKASEVRSILGKY
ncbi:Indoleamine 2,3-dioxygenase-domain-containing protein [Hypoxylon fragiforme]|uniref:Indoleamine 2,3-dioxygenase-domain-containing protein n=1 Tax=Hypoxylon fragiforme TaxID=63214 RepID=UPI0020C6DFBF|nr:Indoleamine 2,3-dioxygenase-domain-containing protein [Hypoxylon fragiforme]KAI2604711.1 Indoleamine 2,3-dioxygenase-domain-containing protein [Hypoxylon fragiforme]